MSESLNKTLIINMDIHIYCNVDDEELLGNDPVTQQWKGSDRCYAMAQYTGVNNGVEDVFCGRCGGYITE
jgi:hypothetical protein